MRKFLLCGESIETCVDSSISLIGTSAVTCNLRVEWTSSRTSSSKNAIITKESLLPELSEDVLLAFSKIHNYTEYYPL